MEGLLLVAVSVALIWWLLFKRKPAAATMTNTPADIQQILNSNVHFYQQLDADNKILFEEKVKTFLSYIRIHGVNTSINDTDKVLVAASAVIPIFGFKDWKYNNLKDVLIYDDVFNAENFSTTGAGRDIAGMVGNGAMNNIMLLSKHELELGYSNKTDKNNTGVHEFVHLLDKSDGSADGIPENLLDKKEIIPWVRLMHKQMQEILKHKSDINPYGATNEAEFFAVVSEYFFERPDLLSQKHPELFALLEEIFHQSKNDDHH